MINQIETLVRKNIKQLSPYSCARDEYKGENDIFLDANENPFGQYNRYPDPYQIKLKERLSQIKGISANKIFIGNGSDEVIDLAFRIFCEPGKDKALTFTPTYGMYQVAADINNVPLVKIPLNEDFQIDLNLLNLHLKDPSIKLLFICSPNNPSGNLLKISDLEYIMKNFSGMVLIDEAYIDFCEQPSFLHRLAEFPRLIVSQTLSKAWGLAGLRLGLAFMNEDVLNYYNKVKPPYNVSSINQEKALEILENETEFCNQVNAILEQKAYLIAKLSKIEAIQKIYSSDGNFILLKVNDANTLYHSLLEKKVIIRNRHSVIENCVRITIGTKEENKALLQALESILN